MYAFARRNPDYRARPPARPAGDFQPARLLACLLLLTTLQLPATATAEAGPLDQRAALQMALFEVDLNTALRADSSVLGNGTLLDLEDDLGYSDNSSELRLDAWIKVASRHRFRARYLDLQRSGQAVLERNIQFQDRVFPANAEVGSTFNVDFLEFAYQFDFISNERVEWGLALGLFLMGIDGEVRTVDDTFIESASERGPLPVIGTFGAVALTDWLVLRSDLQLFQLKVDTFDGSFTDFSATLEFRPHKSFAVGVGYYYSDLDLELDAAEFSGKAQYEFQGPALFVNVGF